MVIIFIYPVFLRLYILFNNLTTPKTTATAFIYSSSPLQFYRKEVINMKLVFTKSNLNKAVGIVMKAVPTRTTMNILECILIDATTNEIKFTGNDMELGIETIVEGEIIEKGKIAIDAKLFSEIVRKLPDNDITLTTDSNNNALITCEKSKFNIAGKSGDDFSYLPAIIKDKMITLSQFQLKEVINQTIFSIAINDNNKMMTGELFEVNEGTLKVVGLDGHRIAIRNIKLEGRSDDVRVVIPGKTLQEISKILNADAESFVNIYFTNNHVLFEFDQTHVVSRLIEGDYFKISQMLSNDYETKVSINKKEFLDSIDRANLLIREGDKKPIIINILNGLLQVNVNSAIGALNEDIDIDKEGKDIMIGFNPKFLMDALRVIDDENVTMYLVNHKSPCFIRDKEENYIYLILPVNFTA